jgi:hypothetical protein
VIEAGTGGTAGVVRVGSNSESVVISQSGKTSTVAGALVAGSLSVTGALSAATVSASGTLTAGALSTAGTLSVGRVTATADLNVIGTTLLTGSLLLGDSTNRYTIGRVPAATVAGRSTFLRGQPSGSAFWYVCRRVVALLGSLTVCTVVWAATWCSMRAPAPAPGLCGRAASARA